MDLEVHALVPVAADPLGAEDDAVLDGRPAAEDVGQLPPDHESNDLPLGQLARRSSGDELPVAHHRDTVGESEDLVDAMADVDDRDALVA